jgi:hypothetical protein
MSLSKRVVSSFLSRIARIVLVEEQNGTLEVSGKYNEMQAVMPRLKSLGFRWDPSKKVCDAVIEEARIRANEAHTRNQARQNLRNLAAKPEHYVGGTGHQPQGEEIALDDGHLRIYGGGEWVVIEPGGQHFWYVRNNGADGDDWSHNNVTTGGAGAIGYRLPMTEEARVLLDVATGKTKLKVAKTAYNYDRSNR